jgi:hypothetical protein
MQILIRINLIGSFNSSVKNPNPIAPKKGTTKTISVLEKIGHQLLKSKHMLMLGQLFNIVPNLKQYVATMFSPDKKKTTIRPNSVITSMVIDLHMVVIQVHVGKNIIEDVLLNGRYNVNIMMEEL